MVKDVRLQIMVSAAEIEAIDDWRFAARISTRADAVRRLIEAGIGAVAPETMVQRREAAPGRDPWVPLIEPWLKGRAQVTVDEIMDGVGIEGRGYPQRKGVERAMIDLGWEVQKIRQGPGRAAKVAFVRASGADGYVGV